MGKRFYLGTALLAALLAATLLINAATRKIYAPAETFLQNAATAALDQDWEEALAFSRSAHSRWLRYRHFTAAVADQSPMDDIDKLFAEMEVFARCRDKEHFAATCAQLAVMCQAMGDAHSTAWWNLL